MHSDTNDSTFGESRFDHVDEELWADSSLTVKPRQMSSGLRDPDSVRYGIFQRIIPSLRHDMVVHLQSIAMLADVLGAKLERGNIDTAYFQKSMSRMNRLVREAVSANLKVASWIDANEDDGIEVAAGVLECVDLLTTSFTYRSIRLVNEVTPDTFEVSRKVLRNLLAGSMLLLGDTATKPSDLVLRSEVSGGRILLHLTLLANGGQPESSQVGKFPERTLQWGDVFTLAHAESADVHVSDNAVCILMNRLRANTPLKLGAN